MKVYSTLLCALSLISTLSAHDIYQQGFSNIANAFENTQSVTEICGNCCWQCELEDEGQGGSEFRWECIDTKELSQCPGYCEYESACGKKGNSYSATFKAWVGTPRFVCTKNCPEGYKEQIKQLLNQGLSMEDLEIRNGNVVKKQK